MVQHRSIPTVNMLMLVDSLFRIYKILLHHIIHPLNLLLAWCLLKPVLTCHLCIVWVCLVCKRKFCELLSGYPHFCSLTPSAPVYEIFILRNHALSCHFHATVQLHNSLVDCDRELFKPTKYLASLLLCTVEKILFCFGFQVLFGWNHKLGRFRPF